MIFVFQFLELIILKVLQLATHQPIVGCTGFVRLGQLRVCIVVVENVSGQF